jgi:uncharacterized protein HemX
MDAIGLGEIAAFAGLAMSVIGSHLRQQQRQDAQLAEIKAEFARLNDAINHRAERVDDRFARVDEKLSEAEASRARQGARIGRNEHAISACEKRHDIAEARLGMPA